MSARIAELLAELDLDEKVSLLGGEDWWHIPAVPRLGIGSVKVSDGPAGVRGAEHSGGPHSASFPCGTALAATWDVDLVERVGRALAAELDSKGAHVILAPTVNLHRTPLAGRSFECFSEDPYLSARLAVAYINGVQSTGKGATVKHLVANDSEHERMTISSEVPERALRELYLVPFEAAVREAGVWCVMTAYNRLGGTYCSEHEELITGILRDEWGFDGLVMSDWYGTHSTAPSMRAGLDLEMPGPPAHRGPALKEAVERGEVPLHVLDARVAAVLQLAERAGVLDAGAEAGRRPVERYDHDLERIALLRATGAAAIVLLKNEPVGGHALLPLVPTTLQRVAVIGPTAAVPSIEGGGSAHVAAPYAVSPLDGLAEALGDGIEVVHEPGASLRRGAATIDVGRAATRQGRRGLRVQYFAGDEPVGEPVREEVVPSSLFRWLPDVAPAGPGRPWSVEVTAEITAAFAGPHTFSVRTSDPVRLWVGDDLADGWLDADDERRTIGLTVDLAAGERVDLRMHVVRPAHDDGGWGQVDVRLLEPVPDDLADRAVALAAGADLAVVVVGLDSSWETEGRDRTDLSLPGGQADLVRRVVAANPRTVVVVNAGAPVEMGWVDDVPAVLQAWYLGQETGNALADVLLGVVDAGGRLPTTIPERLEDLPAQQHYPGEGGQVHYGEGLLIGYRAVDELGLTPRFPFGHGLSYTTVEYGEVALSSPTAGPGRPVEASVTVTNTGDRPGDHVVQLYVRDVEASVPRPVKELKGFARVHLAPAESATVTLALAERAFAFWDPVSHDWVAEAGEHEVLVGASSADIRGRATLRWDPGV